MELTETPRIPDNVLKQAATWLARIQERPLNEAEQQDLQQWRSQSNLHEQAWQRAEHLGNKLREIPSDIGMSVLARPGDKDRRQFIKKLVLLLTTVPAGTLAYQYLPWQGFVADYNTAKGEQKTVQLADGSELRLNTDSIVDVSFDAHQRLIKLYQGEIFIATAKDSRPFWVQTADGGLHALGTKFVVRKQDESSYLGVIESMVDVIPQGNPTQHMIIEEGHQTTFNATQVNQPATLEDNADAWLDGIIYADNMPLNQFVEILSRYRTGITQCDDSCADVLVSGAFQLNDPNKILSVLEKTRPIRIDWKSRYWATLYKK